MVAQKCHLANNTASASHPAQTAQHAQPAVAAHNCIDAQITCSSSSGSGGSVASASSLDAPLAAAQAQLTSRMASLVRSLPAPAGGTAQRFSNAGPLNPSYTPLGDLCGEDDVFREVFLGPLPTTPPLAPSVQTFLASTEQHGLPGLSEDSIHLVLARTHTAVAADKAVSQRQNTSQKVHMGLQHVKGAPSGSSTAHAAAASPHALTYSDLAFFNPPPFQGAAGIKSRRQLDGAASVSSLTAATDEPAEDEHPLGIAWLLALGTGRVDELRFNSGAFMIDGGIAGGVDAAVVSARIASLLAAAPERDILNIFRHDLRRGGLPLRLLQPVAPQLRAMLLQRTLLCSASSPACDSALHRIMFDGLHLSTPGLAAALVAWHEDTASVLVPPTYVVVMAPSAVLHGQGTSSPAHHAVGREPLQGIVNSQEAPLSFVVDRWPHLPALFHTAPSHAVQEARAFLQGLKNVYAVDAADMRFASCTPHTLDNMPLVPSVPRTLVAIQREHAERSSVATVSFVLGTNCRSVQWVGYNSRLVELMGMQDWPMQELIGTPRPAGAPQPRWLHPSCLTKRALAYMAASNLGASSFQVEAQFVRCSPPATVAGGAQTPPFTPYLDGWTASSFYAVETVHYERYHNGLPMARTSYISDVIPVHGCVPLHELEHDTVDAQLASIENMILSEHLPLEVSIAVRRTGLSPAVALKASGLDTENERILVRMFLLAAGGHGLLDGSRQGAGLGSLAAPQGLGLASLHGGFSAHSSASEPESTASSESSFIEVPTSQHGTCTTASDVATAFTGASGDSHLAQRSQRAAALLAARGASREKVMQNAQDMVYILSGTHDTDGLTVTVGSEQYTLPCISGAAAHVMASIMASFDGEGDGFTFDQIAKLELVSIPFA